MTDTASRRFSQGQPSTIPSADDRYLSLCARRNITTTLAELRSSQAASSGGEHGTLVFIHNKSVKEMHTDQAVSVLRVDTQTPMFFSHGNVNAYTYRDDILDVYMCLYPRAIFDALVLQDYNARLLKARIVDSYLEQETVLRMQWLA
ncbi:transposable element Tcb1 transposase [Trichonephila clavipes]|nr:transposable element Tcb1 transposase [Trichonephila clavipes]